MFAGRKMRSVPDSIAQFPGPFKGGVFNEGFVQRAHL